MPTKTKTKPRRRKPVARDMSADDYQRLLKKLGACPEARHAADGKSLRAVWHDCDRGDWLLWLAGRIPIDRKLLVLAACDCARTALKCVPEGDDRPRKAIETAEAWARGQATIRQVYATSDAAEAAGDEYSFGAAYASIASSNAAYAAAFASFTAEAAACASIAGYYASNAAKACKAPNVASIAASVRARIPFALISLAANKALKC